MITTLSHINIVTKKFFLMIRTFKIYCLSSFQMCDTALTIGTMQHIASHDSLTLHLNKIHLSLYLLQYDFFQYSLLPKILFLSWILSTSWVRFILCLPHAMLGQQVGVHTVPQNGLSTQRNLS